MDTAPKLYAHFLQDIQQTTGRTADERKRLLHAQGFTRHSDRVAWLRDAHNLPSRAAYLISSHSDPTRPTYADSEGLVQSMYQGPNAALRPLHDTLTELAMMLGSDVTVSVAKTMVTFRRKHVFAMIKPATKTRIDFGLALPELDSPPERLIPTGGLAKGDRITYRFAISCENDIDQELEQGLEQDYLATAPAPA